MLVLSLDLGKYHSMACILDSETRHTEFQMAISNHRVRKVGATRTVAGEAFVRGLAQHVLPRGFRRVRHCGWMSSNTSIRFEELKLLVWQSLGWVYWLASAHGVMPEAALAKTQLRCGHCGGVMRVVAICNQVVDPKSISALGDHSLAYLDSG